MVVIPLTVLALLVACAGALLRPRWDVAVLAGLLAAVWTRVNQPVEGRVLVSFSATRGFTEADLLSVAALLVAGTALLRCAVAGVRRHRSRHRAPVLPLRGPGLTRAAVRHGR
ncbi:hypothetical protein [Kineococcus glutinatus]|uniref:hypothetical protein n=1 Tax=Kineococcus glutinatus TaxID=1070872 RepID=UPI0031EEF1CD